MSQRNVNPTGVSHWLIHHAACHAPPSFAQRLEEEWLADLAERPSAMSRLPPLKYFILGGVVACRGPFKN
jgi:hypothetical protein